MIVQQDKITQLHGDTNPATVDMLEEEIGKINATIISYHYDEGDIWGHLAAIIP
jgi:hypothetical protein